MGTFIGFLVFGAILEIAVIFGLGFAVGYIVKDNKTKSKKDE